VPLVRTCTQDPNVEYWGTEDDNDGDPPRLWAANASYPGTAFTRSIGDKGGVRGGVGPCLALAGCRCWLPYSFVCFVASVLWPVLLRYANWW